MGSKNRKPEALEKTSSWGSTLQLYGPGMLKEIWIMHQGQGYVRATKGKHL